MLISKVFSNSYRDSVMLMRMAGMIRQLEGVENAEVMIATDANKTILEFNKLLTDEIRASTPNDLVISVNAENREAAEKAIQKAEDLLLHGTGEVKRSMRYTAKSTSGAFAIEPGANLALLSIPGPLVKKDALKLLDKGLHLMIFSDNVPIEEELEIKQKALEKDLIVMGPDCGTAIINGTALAFANVVKRGRIGMICASGTGLQEISALISNLGGGISHAIGTGGNDVSDAIGGMTMKQGLQWLENDPNTEIIVIASKPAGKKTMAELQEIIKSCKKKLVVNFLGSGIPVSEDGGIYFTKTLEETARMALEIMGISTVSLENTRNQIPAIAAQEASKHKTEKYLRALYTGGSLASEAGIICKELLQSINANVPLKNVESMTDPFRSSANCIVDLGADEFTLGKPHPMIDPEVKNQRLLQEAKDSEVAVLLLDFVLGYGIHPDPVGVTLPFIIRAQKIAHDEGRYLTFVASVTGTDDDPQNRTEQVAMLQQNGVFVMPTNAQASLLAAEIILACERREADG